MTNAHWIYDDDAAWEARRARFHAAMRSWNARQEKRTDWGMLLQLLGAMALPIGLVLPFAFIGEHVSQDALLCAMAAIVLGGMGLFAVGLPIKARFDAADPKPGLNDC